MNYTKRCSKCQEDFPATTEFFYKKDDGEFGVMSQCKECIKRQRRTYYQDNKDKELKRVSEYCQNNKTKRRQYEQNYYQQNKEKILNYQKEYNKDNSDKIKTYRSKYNKSSHGKAVRNHSSAVRRVRKRNQTQFNGTPNTKLITKIYQYCPDGYVVDHIIALASGGDHHESNLCYLPASVNISKHNKSIEEFGVDQFNQYVIYWQDLI